MRWAWRRYVQKTCGLSDVDAVDALSYSFPKCMFGPMNFSVSHSAKM